MQAVCIPLINRKVGDKMNLRLYQAVKRGQGISNIHFSDFCNLIVDLGFTLERQHGTSHRLYWHDGINKRMNVQDDKGKAKISQVRQLRDYIIKYNL